MKRDILFLGTAIIIISAMFFLSNTNSIPINPNAKLPSGMATGNIPKAADLNYDNLAPFLSKTQFIKDLPKNSQIMIQFYNYNTGNRQIERSFILEKDKAMEGISQEPDLTILIHSKYIPELNTLTFCSTIAKARNNGDFGMSFQGSEISLAWKFRNMKKYSDCFGF